MAYFFAGRLWVSPAVMSAVDDSAMLNPNANVGNNVAILGRSVGGAPGVALEFGSPDEAKAALVSGDLLDAIVRCFDPSSETVGPSKVIGIRVNPAVQAELDLLNASSAAVINLVSTDYGLRNNQIKVKLEAATTRGFKVTTQFGDSYYSDDDIYRDAFTVRYTGGQASSRMTIGATTIVLEAPNSTTVATVDLTVYKTIQEVVDYINSIADFTATVNDGNGAKPALNGLDGVSNQDVKTADYVALANLQAVVDWFNGTGEGYISATRAAGATAVPVAIPFTYLTGGSDGTVTNTEWSNGFVALQSEDVSWVVPCSSSPSIHAMADAHVAYMSNVGQKERRAICGTPLATSDTTAITLAKAINSDRTSLTHLGGHSFNAAGELTLYEPFVVAAMIAGGFAGVNPGTPLTNKSLKLSGMERKLRNPTDTDKLIKGGVLCVETSDTGFRVVQSISTWLNNSKFNRVEQSVGAALDFTVKSLRAQLAPLKGQKNSPSLMGQAASIADTTCRALSVPEPQGPGVLVGDAASPPYKNIQASIQGDVLAVKLQVSPGLPANYIPITVYAVPYSGSTAAA